MQKGDRAAMISRSRIPQSYGEYQLEKRRGRSATAPKALAPSVTNNDRVPIAKLGRTRNAQNRNRAPSSQRWSLTNTNPPRSLDTALWLFAAPPALHPFGPADSTPGFDTFGCWHS